MEILTQKVESIISKIAKDEKLARTFSYSEVFPALESNPECVAMLEKAAKDNNLSYEYMESPFRWSEDFSYFTEKYNGGFFGLGSGEDQPNLHNPDFNFPDEIIDTGINMFYSIYEQIISK
jgi:metal-dependent amidase/aminoacylase/carboxypeptidase family protein